MSQFYEARKDPYLISTDPALLNVGIIHRYLSSESYWAQHIPFETVQRSITNSLCFGLYENRQQTGFARVVTDRATFAYLADVFILPSGRGKGHAKWMLSVIQAHPELQGLRRWMLGTRDAHGLYKQFGWTEMDEDTRKRFMQRYNRSVYEQLPGK